MGNLSPIAEASFGRTRDYAPGNVAESIFGWDYSGDNGTKATVMANLDRAGGGFSVTMDGTDNDCETAHWGGEKVDATTAGNRFGFTAEINVTEADEGDASIFVGFSDTVGATLLSDAGAVASSDSFGFHVLGANESGGSAFFRSVAQNGATNSGETSTVAYAAATTYRLRMEAEVGTAGITARFYVDDTLASTLTEVSTTGTGLMHPIVAITTNGTNADVLNVYGFAPWSTGN